MSEVVRARELAAEPERIWEILADAHTHPRWWPRVTRVESVLETGFTQVLTSRRGLPIRLDLLYTEVDEPRSLAWSLDLPGSQFERLLSEWSTGFRLAPADGGTRLEITERQTFRGSFRTGALFQARAARRRLEEALDGLAALL